MSGPDWAARGLHLINASLIHAPPNQPVPSSRPTKDVVLTLRSRSIEIILPQILRYPERRARFASDDTTISHVSAQTA